MGKRTWTDEEIKILYDNFPDGGIYKCMEMLPHKKRSQIKAKIDALGIKSNRYDKWTDEENEKLKDAWENYSMEQLLAAFPGRTYQKIQLHANWLGYHSKTDRKRKCDLTFLDTDKLNKENLYWWGFIMADGHLSKNGAVMITLKDVDEEHLRKIADKLSVPIHKRGNFVSITANDKPMVEKWKRVMEMQESAKTYFPPNLKIFENDFIYFFIGFVDGDGCIWKSRNYPSLKIEVHHTWKDNIDDFARILKENYEITSVKTEISKKGTAVLSIGNRNDIIKISKFAKEVDYLERKWDKIFDYSPAQKRGRSKTYSEYINNLKGVGVFSLKDAYKKNCHPERGAKRFSVSLEQIDKDLKA